jgi:hypothetical protein
MRPKVVAPVIVAFVLLCAGLLWLKRLGGTSADSAGLVPSVTAMDRQHRAVAKTIIPKSKMAESPPEAKAGSTFEVITSTPVNDSTSDILNSLIHLDREGREAKIEEIKESGDSNAIPALKAASEWTTNLDEKIELLEAAEFLSLPPLAFEPMNIQKTPEQIAAVERHKTLRRLADESETRERHPQSVIP